MSAQAPVANERRKQAVVVGAGPSGSLTAALLAARGWLVVVVEKRPSTEDEEMGGVDVSTTSIVTTRSRNSRSYNIVLNDRGLNALEAAGVDLPEERIVRLEGNVRHTAKAAKVSSSFKGTVSISRVALAEQIFLHNQREHAETVRYLFSYELKSVDFDRKVAIFSLADTPSSSLELSYDLLVGSDGVGSKTRSLLLENEPTFQVQQNTDHMEFRTLLLPQGAKMAGGDQKWNKCFHTWPEPLPTTMLAPPNPDGTLTGVIVLPSQGERTWSTIMRSDKPSQAVRELLEDCFPDAYKDGVPQAVVEEIAAQRTSAGGITTVCSRLHDPRGVALVGDAAHSMWAALGQGCNAALETCLVLAETLDKNRQQPLSYALEQYTSTRKPDTDAIGRLSEKGMGGTKKRAASNSFLINMGFQMVLSKILPWFFKRPALLEVNGKSMGYAQIENKMHQQAGRRLLLYRLIALTMNVLLALRLLS